MLLQNWTNEEIGYLKENYKNFSMKHFVEKFGKTRNQILRALVILKIRKWESKQWTKEELRFLIENYPTKGKRYCSEKLKVNLSKVRDVVKRMKLKRMYLPPDLTLPIKCSKCNIEKPRLEFRAHLRHCKSCEKDTQRAAYHKDVEKSRKKSREHNKKRDVNKKREYEEKYKTRRRELEKNRYHEKYKHDLNYKLRRLIKGLARRVLKGEIKDCHSIEMLGCSVEEFKKYIESKFLVNMSWENYGVFGWHVDHILPVDSFNLSDSSQRKICCHYQNLQPLWATTAIAQKHGDFISIGNSEKSNKIPV